MAESEPFEPASRGPEELELLQSLLDCSSDLLCMAEGDGRVVASNLAWRAIFGEDAPPGSERSLLEVAHPDDRPAMAEALAAIVAGGPRRTFETRIAARRFAWHLTAGPHPGLVCASARDVTVERQAEERQARIESVLIDLICLPGTERGDFVDSASRVTEMAGRLLEVGRASVWRFDAGRTQIACLDLYESATQRHTSGEVLLASQYPEYFDALDAQRSLVGHDAHRTPEFREFVRDYFPRHGITSMLDVPVRQEGAMAGILCLEHVGPPRRWTRDEIRFAEALGDFLALALESEGRQKAEDALHESEAKLKAIFEHSTDAIYIKDLSGRFLLLNPAAATGMGNSVEALTGTLGLQGVTPDTASRLRDNDMTVLTTGEPQTFEEVLVHATTGATRTYLSTKFPYRTRDGVTMGVIGISRDVTDYKHSLEEVAARTAELEQARALDRLKSQFVNAVSHDLRIPLTAMVGYTELLTDGLGGPLTEAQVEWVHRLKQGIDRLSMLIADLLDYARVQVGVLPLHLARHDLDAEIAETTQDLKPLFDQAGVGLSLTRASGPVSVCVDGPRIQRALYNLLHNALKFTPRGGRVTVRLHASALQVRCEVEDTGPGIEPADQAKLFQPFVQLANRVHVDGTGLGLSIVKAIIEAHGGTVGLRSVPGQGSVFWFALPREARGRRTC